MAIAISVGEFLKELNIEYQVLNHSPSNSSFGSASTAHINSGDVAKAVILRDQQHEYLMAVVPASHRVAVANVNQLMHDDYQLASELEINALFADCDEGAIPALGAAYNLPMAIDDSLMGREHIYIEAGDHQNLLEVSSKEFHSLMDGVAHGAICGRTLAQPRDVEAWFSSEYL